MTTELPLVGQESLTVSQGNQADDGEIEAAVSGSQFISVKQARRAAKRAGFVVSHVGKLRGHSEFGKYLQKLNPIAIGRSELAFNLQNIEQTLKECEAFTKVLMRQYKRKELESPESVACILKVRRDLLDTHGKSAAALIESAQLSPPTDKQSLPSSPSFPPQILQASQMAVYNNPPK